MLRDETVFQISDECVALGLLAGVIMLRDVAIAESPATLRRAIQSSADEVRRRFNGVAAIRDAPEVQAFRRIYEAVGVNPARHAPACERLLEMVWKRRDLPRINTLVDLYNMVSVEGLLSLGAHDLEAVALPIHLRIASRDESFAPLGSYGGGDVRRGEFAYFDARQRVVCRLDLVQAEFSKITARTSGAVLIVEGTRAHDRQIFEKASHALMKLASDYCGGTAEIVSWPF
jgi:DNA/RNA-binding domain of Phe-tRNA-synthetase-like protein